MPSPQTFSPTSGTDGRVKTPGTGGKYLAGISSWRRSSKTNTIPIPHFESPANADGVVQPRKLRGLGDGGTVAVEGVYNLHGADGTETVLRNGLYVTLDLLGSRSGSLGYAGVAGWVSDFQSGSKISNEAMTFSATLDVDGVFPEWGAVPNA